MDKINIAEDVLIASGLAIGLSQIQSILGIIIVSIQLILILIKGICKIRTALKNKDYKEVEKIIDDTSKQIEDTKKNLDKDNGK